MKLLRLAFFLLLLDRTVAFGQSTTGANGEPIVFLPHGGIAHDRPVKPAQGYIPPASYTPADQSWIPHPVLFLGPSLVGNGYQTFAGNFGAALLLNSRRLLGDLEASYMNAKKTNDNTVNNRKGHERFLNGRFFYPWRNGWYFGGGAQWSETSTTNYTKTSWRPAFGLTKDSITGACGCRWQLLYVTPGSDHSNALQGPEFQFWIPSPESKSHFFFRQSIGVYEFHTTVTDPTNRPLTARQTSERNHAGFADFSFGWKF
jgi:hypothetical protein